MVRKVAIAAIVAALAQVASAERIITTDWFGMPDNITGQTFSNWFFNVYMSQKVAKSQVLASISSSSTMPVTSKAIYTALNGKAAKASSQPRMTFEVVRITDSEPWSKSVTVSGNKTLAVFIDNCATSGNTLDIGLAGYDMSSRVIIHKANGTETISVSVSSGMTVYGASSVDTSGAEVVLEASPFGTDFILFERVDKNEQ